VSTHNSDQWTQEPLHNDGAEQHDNDTDHAIQSMTESLLALRTLHGRLRGASDPTLQGILGQQLSREKEHVVMVLEWMRQRDPVLDEHLRSYIFQPSESAPAAVAAPAPVVPAAPAPAPAPVPSVMVSLDGPQPPPAHTPSKGVPLTFNPSTRIRG